MIRRITTVLAATGTLVLLATGVAAADPLVWTWNSDTPYAGSAQWTENGDTLEVCDRAADGAGVRGYIYRPNSGDHENGTVLIKASDGNATNGCVTASKDIDENITIAMKVCLYRGSAVFNCDYRVLTR